MVLLNDLPTELIQLIIWCLRDISCSVPAIKITPEIAFPPDDHIVNGGNYVSKLSKCSRRLNNLSMQFLYESFFENHTKSLQLFIKTIATKPDLRQLVKTVHLHGLHWLQCATAIQPLTENIIQLMAGVLSFGSENCTYSISQDIPFWVVVGFIICTIPNLTNIDLGPINANENVREDTILFPPFIESLVARQNKSTINIKLEDILFFSVLERKTAAIKDCNVEGSTRFRSLKSMSMGYLTQYSRTCHLDLGKIYLTTITKFLALKSLDCFLLIATIVLDDLSEELYRKPLVLKELHLVFCIWPRLSLVRFLDSVNNLEVFRYSDEALEFQNRNDDDYARPWTIVSHLSHMKHCLKELTIACGKYRGPALPGEMTSLAAFTALEVWSCDVDTMLNVNSDDFTPNPALAGLLSRTRLANIVPPNLRILELFTNEEPRRRDLFNQVFELLEAKAQRAPHLEEIRFTFCDEISWPYLEEFEEVLLSCGCGSYCVGTCEDSDSFPGYQRAVKKGQECGVVFKRACHLAPYWIIRPEDRYSWEM